MSMSSISILPSIKDVLPNKDQNIKVHMSQGLAIGVILTALSYFVGFSAGWVETINWLEVFAVFTSYVCTFLCVVERRANYPIGAISNAAYALLFFQFGLYASAATTAYLTFALAYGWFRWKSDSVAIPVRHVELKWIPVYLLATAAFYGAAFLLVTAVGGTLAATDSVILVGTMIAQFLLDNKRIETWAVWATVNVFAIYTYGTAGLALVVFQYVFFLLNVFYGWYMWNSSMKLGTFSHTALAEGDYDKGAETLEDVPENIKTKYGLS